MKKLMIVLMCMMLCGCVKQSEGNTNVTTTSTPLVTTTTTPLVTTTTKLTTTVTTTTTSPQTVATTTVPTTVTTTTPITTTTKPIAKGLVELTSGDILNKIFNQETFIMYLGTSHCSHCIKYKPQIEEFLKDYPDVTMYYVVLDKSDEFQTSELVSLLGLEYTPTTYLIVNGATQDMFVGTGNNDKLIEMINFLK